MLRFSIHSRCLWCTEPFNTNNHLTFLVAILFVGYHRDDDHLWGNFWEEYLRTTNFPKGILSRCRSREFLVHCSDVRVISTSSWFKYVLNFGWWNFNTSSKHQTELLWLDNLAQANRSEDERLPRSIFDSIYLRCFPSCLGAFRRQAPESSNSTHCCHIFITLLCSRRLPWRRGNSLCR